MRISLSNDWMCLVSLLLASRQISHAMWGGIITSSQMSRETITRTHRSLQQNEHVYFQVLNYHRLPWIWYLTTIMMHGASSRG